MHEVLRKAFAGTEYTLDFTYMPYGRAIQETLDGLHDVVTYAGTPNTPDFVFVRNLDMINVVQFATLAGAKWSYTGHESLEDIRFSTPAGFRTGDPFIDNLITGHEQNPPRIKTTSSPSPSEAQRINLQCLLEGRIDAMLVGSLAFRHITRKTTLENKLRLDQTPVAMFYNRIAFSPKHPNADILRDIVENRIREMRISGELGTILDHYGVKP
ncbi:MULTISPECIES: hypothetical protein [unclassified Pseudodesulfovibrio]|uniref:substrate-binding periplasmic protein n=1 Tax=unclassified Pseudodesulfovibrio TaxID=2661612 RepID=UPI000FEBDA42|nr:MULTISPECIES: hypothetical protein [unclassified Pseudodesulfovibrio]MCJ2163308.1 transporter substrate-binding domain-containing protein [Pseudodesulfovibrio sp. S3-i]RWU07287.1 hypothetical protein DWB63_01955 [Pseudodesulfovibrio sp. S3]